MPGLRKKIVDEGAGFLKDVIKLKPKVNVEMPTTSDLAERLEEIYPRSVIKNKAPEIQKLMPSTSVELPTTEQTVRELKRRLAKELYRMELDLQSGARIAGRPCDCLDAKHRFGLEATAEELMSYEANPIYGEIIAWLNRHEVEFEPGEIAKHPPEYYHKLAPEVRRFRKEVMGTEVASEELTLDEAKKLAAQEAEKEVEKLWQSQGKK